ncbi:hypothetical protein ANN_16594 [Periplaneta americana]|uniref:C2H2-type domain-containing protein n=1 Tax=Periplaneta americana TaxID=6978 RepID=A0ABQ8SS90_PERAM|nr:hypothetical protein ANN_16594 [Periplaneta americana]
MARRRHLLFDDKAGNTRFSTRKTLNHHMKSLHVTFRVCYPCPCCKNTFCNKWSVYRHLYKVHRKTTLQVRKLRSQIVNKAFKKEMATQENKNSNAKSTSISAQSEADKARKEQQRLHQENQAWMNNFEDDLELQMCGGCGRRFERRAALNSHSQICQKRIAIQNNIKARRPSPSVPTPSSTSNRVTNTKVSTERQNSTRADTSSSESNANRLTPLSVISDSGVKCMMTPSPSPVPLDITTQLHASSPNASYNRTRHCSGSRADNTKKDIPEKRIEIQIRRDYCKTGSAVNSVAGVTCQQDLISEENENSPSSDIEENAEGDNVDRESGAEFATKDTDTKLKENVGADDCNSSVASESDKMESEGVSDEDCALSLKLEDSDDDNVPSVPDVVEGCDTYVDFVKEKSEDREADTEWNSVKTDMLHNSRELQNDVVEAGEMLDKISTSTVAKKEEQFSPVMENRMQSMINIRRLQCLSCQKKFNKLTNLKRHVAVHIGWNRYRCIQCTFKCYSKYDCVAHVNKVHLGNADKEKAQTMVQSIETQGSDGEYNSSKCDITEESYKVKNEESGIDINLTDKYETTAADIEITLNNPCTEVSDWTLLDCNDSKTSSPEYNITIEAIPTNPEESPLKEEATEECLLTSEEQGYKDMEIDPLMSIKEHGSITGTLRTYKVKGGKGSSVNRQTTTDPQEPNKSTIPTLRLRPKRRRASNEELETVTSKKALRAVEYEKNVGDVAMLDVQENEAHKPKTETYVHNDSDSTSADAGSQVEDPSDKQDAKEQTALRKMVLEVIFGSSNNNMNQDLEATHNMFSVAVNGEHYPLAGSESSPEPYDVIETVSSDSTSPLTTNSSAASPLLTSDDGSSVVTEQAVKDDGRCSRQTKCGNSVTPVYETERRQRPVRNRVKVEKEDFIYDLSDRCLDPRRDREERSSHSSKASRRKLQEERTRDSMKMAVEKGNYSGENSAPKLLPKLMLVRTNLGEYTGVKVVKPGNSTVTQAFDNSSGTNSSSNAVGYNISTRKSQRTFDISPHKIPPSNKDRINEDE